MPEGNVTSKLAQFTHQERAHSFLRKEMVSCNCLSRHFFVGSSYGWWNCLQQQPGDKCSHWFPADISYSIPQLAGDLMSKCNFRMKCHRERLVFQMIFLKVIFSVGILILIWQRDKVLQTPITHLLYPFT